MDNVLEMLNANANPGSNGSPPDIHAQMAAMFAELQRQGAVANAEAASVGSVPVQAAPPVLTTYPDPVANAPAVQVVPTTGAPTRKRTPRSAVLQLLVAAASGGLSAVQAEEYVTLMEKLGG